MNIGFIKASNEIDVQWFLPLSFGYLKAYLVKKLSTPINMTYLDSLLNIDSFEIIGISATSQDYASAIQIAQSIKKKDKRIITILGGHHITYLPETLTKDFDIAVRREGEETFFQLIKYFSENGFVIIPEKLKLIKGINFWQNDILISTEDRELISLDDIPHPYREIGKQQYVFTSRGCPYKCRFCSSSAFWEKARFFKAEFVVEEIEQLLNQFPQMNQIPIWDDLFIADNRRLMDIINLIETKGINKKVNFNFSVRANLITEEMCVALKRLNVNAVSFGAESGSDRILKLINKQSTISQNQKALDLLFEYDIPVACSFIVGWPTETEEEVKDTFEFILQNVAKGKLTFSNAVNILMPIPGTDLWDQAINEGLINQDNFNWNRLSIFSSYKDSNLRDFDEWVEYRRNNDSLYLNENSLPIDRLYILMKDFYHTLDLMSEIDNRKQNLIDQGETSNMHITNLNTDELVALQEFKRDIQHSRAWKLILLLRRFRDLVTFRRNSQN